MKWHGKRDEREKRILVGGRLNVKEGLFGGKGMDKITMMIIEKLFLRKIIELLSKKCLKDTFGLFQGETKTRIVLKGKTCESKK